MNQSIREEEWIEELTVGEVMLWMEKYEKLKGKATKLVHIKHLLKRFWQPQCDLLHSTLKKRMEEEKKSELTQATNVCFFCEGGYGGHYNEGISKAQQIIDEVMKGSD